MNTPDIESELKGTLCNTSGCCIDPPKKWDDFGLCDDLLRGIYSYGFEVPSEIQQKAIIPIMSGRDIIAQAKSGSGKTATFTIGSLQCIDLVKGTQVLVLSPTHELVRQTSCVFTSLGMKMENLSIKTLVGGVPVANDINEMRLKVPHVIVGSPGRGFDLIERHTINVKCIKLVILDEADELLSSGFKTDIFNIFNYLNEDIQVAMFSATLPDEILTLINTIMRNPVRITVKSDELNVEGIEQFYITVSDDRAKFEKIKLLYSTLVMSQCVIFVNSVNRVIDLYDSLNNEGFPVSCIHSSMSKADREKSLSEFRRGATRTLISSNIIARGIDVQQVGMVINFDICNDVHTYLHRIGRGGRYGKKGIAINLITRYDIEMLKKIEKHYKVTINEYIIPSASASNANLH